MFQTRREQKEELRMKIFILLGAIALLLIVGMFFYHFSEGWSYMDALYFSAISLTARGFSQQGPSNWVSVLFSIFYLLMGAAIVIYTISTFVAFYTSYYQKRMQKRVEKVSNLFKREKPKENKWLVLKTK